MPSAVVEGSVATEVLSCMRLYTLTGVAVENSYILSRRLRHHCAIINYRVLRRLRRHHRSPRHRFFVVFISLQLLHRTLRRHRCSRRGVFYRRRRTN